MPFDINGGCTGKAQYESKAAALEVVRRRGKRRFVGRTGYQVTVYHCRLCQSWHIGSARK